MSSPLPSTFVEAVECRFPWHDGWGKRCPRCLGIGWEVVERPQVVRLAITEVADE